MPINCLVIGEILTANAKRITSHFNTFLTSVAAKLNDKIVKTKKYRLHIISDRLLMKLSLFLQQLQQR